ncbi:hypothetical protein L3X38_033113 [Prunus dulcis]|uniref:Uncharacterized protein n=1 Tax=Prunus dulcis TaxID=3755 RepID=A0AAD4YWJ7_PRUDU|nr:hypothetical protein L3X38_033113 [Prunus dulcis]
MARVSRPGEIQGVASWALRFLAGQSSGFLRPDLGGFVEAEGQGRAGARCGRESFEIRLGIVQSAASWAVLKSGWGCNMRLGTA